jgi:hypothetical protein
MAMQPLLVALALALTSGTARGEPISWQRYSVPETGAAVDIPNTIFAKDAGKPKAGYGQRFLTSDGRANLTVQSFPNDTGDSPASFLAKKNPPSNIVYRRITPSFFVVSSFREGNIWYTGAILLAATLTAC